MGATWPSGGGGGGGGMTEMGTGDEGGRTSACEVEGKGSNDGGAAVGGGGNGNWGISSEGMGLGANDTSLIEPLLHVEVLKLESSPPRCWASLKNYIFMFHLKFNIELL